MQTERTGSSKLIRAVEPGVVDFIYSRGWSANDRGRSAQEIPLIDQARCACAVKSFQLARDAGIPTHFIEQVDRVTIRVREFSVPGRASLSGKAHGVVTLNEWLWRVAVYGSLLERLRDGRMRPEQVGFPPGTTVREGMRLLRLMLECTTKFEPVDRHLSSLEARALTKLSDSQFEMVHDLIKRSIEVTDKQWAIADFESPDGKLEIGMENDGSFVIVDVFGTQDENRILDRVTGEIYSKDIIRNYLKRIGWTEHLADAKKKHPDDKSKWPEYPVLPPKIVNLVSERYAEVAFRYSGVQVQRG